ncbi:MAG TPA: hypothetical protein VEX69_02465 [Candidatus Limnocylindria bacterium]|nr:hypothetical protein [Candidatus Limnocylindria bacterium]
MKQDGHSATPHVLDLVRQNQIGEKPMSRSLRLLVVSSVLLSLLAAGVYSKKAQAQAAPQYPIMDMIGDRIIQKYQTSTCEQLWQQKVQPKKKPSQQEQEMITLLRNDPQMRAAFINKIAPPIANKMFDCGMIP